MLEGGEETIMDWQVCMDMANVADNIKQLEVIVQNCLYWWIIVFTEFGQTLILKYFQIFIFDLDDEL